jgi:5-oxoprolinase (ATP-hydrolysing) subunit B
VSTRPELHRVAERALLVRFPDADLARAVARAQAFESLLERHASENGGPEGTVAQELPWKGEVVPGAGNLLLRFDDAVAAREVDEAHAWLDERLAAAPLTGGFSGGGELTIDVDFGGEAGPDLGIVADEAGLQPSAVVELFCAAAFTVAFVGFSPGFPYLIGLPEEIEVERLATPRARVPAGSVAIAGPFAGVYPSATPGGWRLLGRTEITLFDPAATPPARLAAGDRVRFRAR